MHIYIYVQINRSAQESQAKQSGDPLICGVPSIPATGRWLGLPWPGAAMARQRTARESPTLAISRRLRRLKTGRPEDQLNRGILTWYRVSGIDYMVWSMWYMVYKHSFPAKHGFCNPPCLGPWNQRHVLFCSPRKGRAPPSLALVSQRLHVDLGSFLIPWAIALRVDDEKLQQGCRMLRSLVWGWNTVLFKVKSLLLYIPRATCRLIWYMHKLPTL